LKQDGLFEKLQTSGLRESGIEGAYGCHAAQVFTYNGQDWGEDGNTTQGGYSDHMVIDSRCACPGSLAYIFALQRKPGAAMPSCKSKLRERSSLGKWVHLCRCECWSFSSCLTIVPWFLFSLRAITGWPPRCLDISRVRVRS